MIRHKIAKAMLATVCGGAAIVGGGGPALAAPVHASPGAHVIRTFTVPAGHRSTRLDCIGDGASCTFQINGTTGVATVTGNTNPHDFWKFELDCLYGGNQESGDNRPSSGSVTSVLGCNFDAAPTHWNVLVDYHP